MTTYTTNKNLALPAYNQTSPTWDNPLNSDFTIIDDAFGGTTTVSLTNVNVTLTQTQTQKACIRLQGTLTGNVIINFPTAVSGYYLVNNATTGAYTVTLAYTGGAGPTLVARQSVFSFVWVDASAGGVYAASNAQLVAGSGISVTGSTIAINSPLSTIYGGTGATSYTDGQLLIGNSASGGLTPATITAGSNITITNGNGTITIASSGGAGAFDPAISYNFTGTQTFVGTTSSLAASFVNSTSVFNDVASAASGTINFDVTTQSSLWYKNNATSNWTMNFRASSGTALNAAMNSNATMVVKFIAAMGSTPYAVSSITIGSSSVAVYWLGGSAPTGYANVQNYYTFEIVKLTSGFVVFASLSQYN